MQTLQKIKIIRGKTKQRTATKQTTQVEYMTLDRRLSLEAISNSKLTKKLHSTGQKYYSERSTFNAIQQTKNKGEKRITIEDLISLFPTIATAQIKEAFF